MTQIPNNPSKQNKPIIPNNSNIPNYLTSVFDNQGNMLIGGIPVRPLAEKYGTPLYIYDETEINQEIQNWKFALAGYRKSSLCYAVKANANLNILKYFWNAGVSFDIVSGGELARLQKIGVSGSRIVFSGVGKSHSEIEMALAAKVRCINVESTAEIERIAIIARAKGVKAPIAIRVNPNIDAKTHPYISTGLAENKFGLTIDETLQSIDKIHQDEFIDLQGIACHIGSNLHDSIPYHQAAESLINLALQLQKKGINLSHLDCGGGIGVNYRASDNVPQIIDFVQPIFSLVEKANLDIELIFEPGRRLIASSGTLITKVEYIKTNKKKKFIVVDAAMNDLMRPTLYQAHHEVIPLRQNKVDNNTQFDIAAKDKELPADIVGPICESGDFLAKERNINVNAGEYLAIKTVGAYGFVLSSNYNARPRAAEIWIENGKEKLIRKRETFADLYLAEMF